MAGGMNDRARNLALSVGEVALHRATMTVPTS